MVALAAELDVSRATLYRWTGDRERLLADAVWAEARATADHMLSAIGRKPAWRGSRRCASTS